MRRTEIGPYRVLRRVKEGGGGTVYLAIDLRLNRRVALKLVAVPRDRESRNRVIAEARALASVSHRSVVQIFDVVEVKSYIVLVMEYVPGLDLEELLELREIGTVAALYLGLDICVALAAAHAAGLVHRDLKPANILLNARGRTRLTDFGIASAIQTGADHGNSTAGPLAGSYSCLSPEQVSGLPVGPRSDLFALGVLLYRLLAGRHPFAETDAGRMLEAIRDLPHKPLVEVNPHIPSLVGEFVDHLLEKDSAARPSSALVARQRILIILRGLPVARDHPLASLMAGLEIPERPVGALVKLPARLAWGGRSHLLSEKDWGPWAISMRSALLRSGLVVVATFVLTGVMYAGNEWWLAHNKGVGLRPPIMRVSEGAALAPEAGQLMKFLHAAVEDHPRLRVREEPVQTVLTMQVQCNPHICGVLLTRTDNSGSHSSYQALSPGAAEHLWEQGVGQGVAQLFGNS